MTAFVTLEDLLNAGKSEIVEVEIEGIGKVKVGRLNNDELIEQSVYLNKLNDAKDPASKLKSKYALTATALRKEDGSRMFATIEEAEKVFSKMPYETFMKFFVACVLDINELNDEKIVEQAKKFKADQSTGATAG